MVVSDDANRVTETSYLNLNKDVLSQAASKLPNLLRSCISTLMKGITETRFWTWSFFLLTQFSDSYLLDTVLPSDTMI